MTHLSSLLRATVATALIIAAALTSKAVPTAYPYFADLFFLNLPRLDSLGLNNTNGVKIVEETQTQKQQCDYYTDTFTQTRSWTFDNAEKLISHSELFLDITIDYSITYNGDGVPTTILYKHSDSDNIIFNYDLTYENDRLIKVTEQLKEINGKKITAPSYTLTINYDPATGKPSSAKCQEISSVRFIFDSSGKLTEDTHYIWEKTGRHGRLKWIKIKPLEPIDDYIDQNFPPPSKSDIEVKNDAHNNWVEKTWKETDSWSGLTRTITISRNIEYF